MGPRLPASQGYPLPPLVVIACVSAAAAICAVPASAPAADSDSQRQALLAKLAKKTGASLDALRAVDGHYALSKDLDQRRRFLKKICESPREDLLPLLAWIAENDRDHPIRLSAIKAFSLFGLIADREDVRRFALPALVGNLRDRSGQVVRFSLDEMGRLNRWFHLDSELVPLYKKLFAGKDFNLRQLAFYALCDMHDERVIEEVVRPAAWEVYRSPKSGIFMQRKSVAWLVKHEDPNLLPELRRNLTEDASLAVVSAWGLTRLLHHDSLPALRKVDHTAVHRLRRTAWRARCLLGDLECLAELPTLLDSRTEHLRLKADFVAGLGAMMQNGDKARVVLEKLWKSPILEIKRAAGLALLHHDDDRGVELLKEQFWGKWEDDPTMGRAGKGWMLRFRFFETLLRCKTSAGDSLLMEMSKIKSPPAQGDDGEYIMLKWWRHGSRREETITDWYDEYKAEAVSQLGERRVQAARKRLGDIYWDKSTWGHLKFHALISLWELEDSKAEKNVAWYLPKYDDRLIRKWRVILGPHTVYFERMKWSTVFDVARKVERVGDTRYLPLIDALIRTAEEGDDPVARRQAGADRDDGAPEKSPRGSRSRSRERQRGNDRRDDLGLPEVEYRMRNQFARRAMVEAAAVACKEEAAPILARALLDCRATVRAAAIREIGRVSERFHMERGASPQEERSNRPAAVAWLTEQGVWPGGD